MPLHRLYEPVTGSMNPNSLVPYLPGGAGVQVTGTVTNPGISAPRLEESAIEVYDVTAPTLIGTNTPGTPAPQGKLLVMDTAQGIGGSKWKLNSTFKQAVPRGQYGIVSSAGQVSDSGICVGTSTGNQSQGSKAVVIYDGPIQAYVNTLPGGTAISAGMPLVADGAGNLTGVAGTPTAGTVLATYADAIIAAGVSIPVLRNVYVGGY